MKKLLLILSICVLEFSLSACGKSEQDNSDRSSSDVSNPPPYTTVVDGKEMTAQRFNSANGSYEIGCYDENNNGKRWEYYKDGKLAYYYISEDFDKQGNEAVQKYYSADGKLIATVDQSGFRDANGKTISEDEMNKLLK